MIPYPVLWGLLVIGLAWQMRVNARSVQVAFTARQLVEQLLLENVEEVGITKVEKRDQLCWNVINLLRRSDMSEPKQPDNNICHIFFLSTTEERLVSCCQLLCGGLVCFPFSSCKS